MVDKYEIPCDTISILKKKNNNEVMNNEKVENTEIEQVSSGFVFGHCKQD